ncbi:MFS transporter [Bacillus cereus]|uniref:MFS transporter n=1 Tax=Bacillus cereus TaxID=1396 RepID=UPI00217CCE08|nr:MFS transporter [Bacillus cereus]MCS6592618.1 MFS transporter [Bacillus cereus]MEB9612769.1 MFS transporter [Bacillus cereus]
MFSNLNPLIRNRLIISFMSKAGASMLLPFIAIYYTRELNAYWASMFIIITTIIQFISGLYGGYKTDLIGRKKLMVIGELIKLVCFLLMVFQFSPYIMFLLVSTISCAQGIINPTGEAMLVDLCDEQNRARILSLNYWVTNLSIMIGTIVGGWLFNSQFIILIILFLNSVVISWITIFKIKETFAKTERKEERFNIANIFSTYKFVLSDKCYLYYTIGSILILGVELQRNNLISIHLAKNITPFLQKLIFGLHTTIDGVKILSILTTINTIIIIFGTPFVISWMKSTRIKPFIIYGILSFALGYSVLAYTTDLLLLFVAILFISVGELFHAPAKQAILADVIDLNNKGSYMAISGINFQVAKIIGAVFIFISTFSNELIISIYIFLLGVIGLTFILLSIKLNEEKIKSIGDEVI